MRSTHVDITNPDLFANGIPHELFVSLRRDAPVLWTDAPADWPESVGRGQWNLTRAADIRKASRDWQTFSSARGGIMMDNRDAGGLDIIRQTLLGKDPPEHTTQRRIVDGAFTPSGVAAYESAVRATVRQCLDEFVEGGPGDIVTGFVKKVVVEVVCDILGIPSNDRERVFQWAQSVIASDDPEMLRKYGRPEDVRMVAYRYVEGLLDERKRCPAHDLATYFTTAVVDGQPVPHDYQVGLFRQLFEAGVDTTMHSFSAGINAFSEFPDQWQMLLDDRSLIPNAVEEMLRWACPVAYVRRTATTDIVVSGKEIKEGDSVILWFASGNFDDDAFADPLAFDVRRQDNAHFAFGAGGRHYCVGASLARMELRIMLEEILKRIPDLRVAGAMGRIRSNLILGVTDLPVAFGTPA